MIAYYAHQQGFGHCNSAQEFCRAFPDKTVVFTASEYEFDKDIEVIRLSNEDTKYIEYLKTSHNLPRYAHYLPKSKQKILHRNFQILENCISENIRFALIDVSVETAIQFRIAGIPYAYHKMMGDRDDLAHQMAYEASEFLFAYYPKIFETSKNKTVLEKTYYLGFLSRFELKESISEHSFNDNSAFKILILVGKGGTQMTSEKILQICKQCPNYHFTLIGVHKKLKSLSNVTVIEFSTAIERLIQTHEIIISSCGLNLTAEILSLKQKFIAFAEDRAYDEQQHILKTLVREKLAVELNLQDVNQSIKQLLELPKYPNMKSLFGKISNFRNVPTLKKHL